MARIKDWMDVGELGDIAQWVAYGATSFGLSGRSIIATQPFTDVEGNGGAYSYRCQQPDAGLITPYLVTPVSTFYWRGHFKTSLLNYNNLPDGGGFLIWRKGVTELGRLALDNSGAILLRIGGSTVAITSSGLIAANVFNTIELKIVIGNSGSYELRINGITRFSGSADTQPGTDTTVDNLVYQVLETAGGEVFHWFDDVGADTANWLDEAVVTTLVPNEAGTTTELTSSGVGDNWQNVDEIPPSDSDFNSTLVANKKDTYVHTALPGAASVVKSVLTVARVVRSGSDITKAYLITRSGGTDYEGSAQPVGTVASIITKIEEVDPNTSAAFVVGDLNLGETGIRFDT